MSKAHVFVTNRETFSIVRDNGFCGIGIKKYPAESFDDILSDQGRFYPLITDILTTRPGDMVFFYENGVGFHGVYNIKGQPFFDSTPIGVIWSQWPIRVETDCVAYFNKPVPESYAFSSTDNEARFWTWFYRKLQGARGLNTINPEAAELLIELLLKVNGDASMPPVSIMPYNSNHKLEIVLPIGHGPKVSLEVLLKAYLMKHLTDSNRSDLADFIGDPDSIEWFANEVPYHVSGKSIDILLYHHSTYSGISFRSKYSVIELKRDRSSPEDVTQVIEYSKWVTSRMAGGDPEMVQPIIIAHSFPQDVMLKACHSEFSRKSVRLVEYLIENDDITFRRLA